MPQRDLDALFTSGQFKKMAPHEQIVYFELATQSLRQKGEPEAEALYLKEMGKVYLEENRDEEADASWQHRLRIHEALRDSQGQAATLDDLGMLNASLMNLSQAQAHFVHGLSLAADAGLTELTESLTSHLLTMLDLEQRVGKDRPASAYVELADFARERGLAEIESAANQILGRREPAVTERDAWWPYDTSHLSGQQLNDNAMRYLLANQSLRAVRIFQRLICDHVEDDPAMRDVLLHSIGDAYREIGLWTDAVPYLQRALAGYLASGKNLAVALITYELATIYRELQETDAVEWHARMAMAVEEAEGKEILTSRAILASALFDAGRDEEARVELGRCLATIAASEDPRQHLGGDGEQLIIELATASSMSPANDWSHLTAALGQRLSTGEASVSRATLRRLSVVLSTPIPGHKRWGWNRASEAAHDRGNTHPR